MDTAALCLLFLLGELCVALFVARFCSINHLDEDDEQ